MIPFAILCGRAFYEDTSSLEIRLLELMPDGFSFRVPCRYEKKKIHHFVLHFFVYEAQEYTEIVLDDFCLSKAEKTEYSVTFHIHSSQEDFRNASIRLGREYLNYIELKLCSDDETLSHALTSSPPAEEICITESVEAQRKLWAEEIRKDFRKESWSFLKADYGPAWILALETEEDLHEFLKTGPQIFWENQWKKHALSWHPLAEESMSGIEIGNSFCISLLPDLILLSEIIHQAMEYHLMISMSFPPVPQSEYQSMIEYVKAVHEVLRGEHLIISFYCNDMGMYLELNKEQWSHFHVHKGILMNKKGKDPRAIYRIPSSCYPQTSYDESPVDGLEDQIYIPYYQTNTATFCTMYAACRFSDRSQLSRVTSCPHYCSRYHFMYLDYLHVIGQYNCIFAMNQTCLASGKLLESYCNAGKNKVVIRL